MNPLMMDPRAFSGLNLGNIGGGMNPLILMSLIQGGSTLANTLFSGLLSGAGIGEERRYKEGIWKQQQAKTKPSQSYYMTPYLAGYDKILMKAVLGNLAEKGGDRFGLDLEKIEGLLGLNRPASSQGSRYAGKYADLVRRY